MTGMEPDAHLSRLLLDDTNKGWFASLKENLAWLFTHHREPALVVTSKPIPVPDIWGDYRYGRISGPASVMIHMLILTLLIVGGRAFVKHSPDAVQKLLPTLFDPGPFIPDVAKDLGGGGGGGGDRSPLPAAAGILPRQALEQLVSPREVTRSPNPLLQLEPTVLVPPEVKIPRPNLNVFGDPLTKVTGPRSNGPGCCDGIGDGEGPGVGKGRGPGVGPGENGGFKGGYFTPGVGGVTAPQLVYSPEPEYTEAARKSKYQGTVVLHAIVDADGRVRNVRVAQGLGLGLDEKAMEAVKQWRFVPGKKDGRPVPVAASIEVTFRLL